MDDEKRLTLLKLSRGFTKGNWPILICTNCHIGHQKLASLTFTESEESKEAENHEAWEPYWINGHFTSSTACQNCKDITYITGVYKLEEFYDQSIEWEGRDNGDPTPPSIFEEVYTVKYMTPAIELLTFPKKCPKTVKAYIQEAAEVVFMNPDLAANRLRASVEALLTEQKVTRYAINKKGERRRLSAHDRIKKFAEKNQDVAILLEAVKWIGNGGSHESVLTFSDVLVGVEIYSHALSILLDKDPSATVRKNASLIIKNKGVKRIKPRSSL